MSPPRPYPHSKEAERAYLGGLIIAPDALDRCHVAPDDFYDPRHGRLFALLRAMRRGGEAIDPVTVPERVGRGDDGGEDRYGGMMYVVELPDRAASTVNLGHYADIIRAHAVRRQILSLAEEMTCAGLDAQRPTGEVITEAVSRLEAMQAEGGSGHWRGLSEYVEEALEEMATAQEGGAPSGWRTGYPALDEVIPGLCQGELWILAARPGMGKSALALGLAQAVAEQGGVVGIYSLEMPGRQLGMRSVVGGSGVPIERARRGAMSGQDQDAICDEAERLRALQVYVDDRPGLSIAQVIAGAHELRATTGEVGAVLVDYLQLCDARGDSRSRAVGEISRGLKGLSKTLGCPVIALSQLSREVERRKDKRPVLSDLRDSGEIEQDADGVMFLYREDYYDPDTVSQGVCECIVSKQRNGPAPRTAMLGWDDKRARFYHIKEEAVVQLDHMRRKQERAARRDSVDPEDLW